jgi:hypothetical protein
MLLDIDIHIFPVDGHQCIPPSSLDMGWDYYYSS